ncbi:hypothetical protein [Serratia sp. UGAL515B_01]|uniref:hypothetical protein n=1 Tax=Serratia sp. UGAL515B_01 TaxID=2986763 RepID=UPI00295310F3|nr:hypothetical protein [Serratia sp. UGAL515B_01]WON77525.1 hypothetical protein OK023_02110 [Serratia sp. UGAL515B_01]
MWKIPIGMAAGVNNVILNLENTTFPSHHAGSDLQVTFPLGVGIAGDFSLNSNNQTGYAWVRIYVVTETDLPPSDINDGYLKLSKDLDIQIRFLGSGQQQRVPFSDTA